MYCILNEGEIGALGRRGIELTSEIMRRHYRRDVDFVWDQMTPDVTWIGPLRTQFTTGIAKLMEVLECERDVTFTMELENYQVAYEDASSCVILGRYFVTSDSQTGLFIRTLQRVSFFYRLSEGRLKVVHMHLSHPYEVMEPDEVFPFRFGKEVYEYIERTHQMAFTDSLTGLGNRNAYETSLMYLSHDAAAREGLCFILFDLNGMKEVNDSLGHLAGDYLLKRFAALLRAAMPSAAKPYRYGGDEFIVTLQGVDMQEVEECLRELERRRDATGFESPIRLHFAWGYAFFSPERDHDLTDTIRRADAMLYARKKAMKAERGASRR